jgi:hypothetical protein
MGMYKENNMEVPQNIKNRTTSNPTAGAIKRKLLSVVIPITS